MGKRRKLATSTGISCQLYQGEDDDIREWWEGLYQGQGSVELKRAIRAYIGCRPAAGGIRIPEQVALPDEVESGVMDDLQIQDRQQHMLSRKW